MWPRIQFIEKKQIYYISCSKCYFPCFKRLPVLLFLWNKLFLVLFEERLWFALIGGKVFSCDIPLNSLLRFYLEHQLVLWKCWKLVEILKKNCDPSLKKYLWPTKDLNQMLVFFNSFWTSTCFVLFVVSFLFKFFSLSSESVFFTKSAISTFVAKSAYFNLTSKFSIVNLLNS